MRDWLDPALEGRDLRIVGVVSSLPSPAERGVRFEFEVESSSGGERLPRKILLWWYRSPFHEEQPALLAGAVHPGERWLFTVRLRRPHGQVNPNGFDYEAWLLERGIGATGYVRQRGEQRRLGARNSLLRPHRAGKSSGARALPRSARRHPGGGHSLGARRRRPARDLAPKSGAFSPAPA